MNNFVRTSNIPKIRILDYGCGDFIVGRSLESDHTEVYGYDPDREMIKEAHSRDEEKLSRLFSQIQDFKDGAFEYCIMSFVHQVAKDEVTLRSFFRDAYSKLRLGGALIIVGAHPAYVGRPFSAFQCDREAKYLKSGDKYGGTIFGAQEGGEYKLKDADTYWSLDIIIKQLTSTGFKVPDSAVGYIADVASDWREAGLEGHPYFKITATKATKG